MAKRPPAKRPPAPVAAGRPAGLFTWLAIGLVVVVVVALVVIKVVSGTSGPSAETFTPTSAKVAHELASVPASVFNTVGVTSGVPVSAPIALKGQPELAGQSSTGATVPEVLYIGAEYCPYCAAERWPLIVALSRFGTFTGLGDVISSTRSIEPYQGTPTFTLVRAHYHSRYITFASVEEYTNVWDSATGFYSPLQKPSAKEAADFKKYDTSKYVPGLPASQDYSFPFLSFANRFLMVGASYTPKLLAGLSRDTIAAGLSSAASGVTDTIVASANFDSAVICSLTKDQPSSVCTSPGVLAAKKALHIS
ncbi:MAG: DUF929 family protein [Acidimicrobiales bacterium]